MMKKANAYIHMIVHNSTPTPPVISDCAAQHGGGGGPGPGAGGGGDW